MDQLVSGNSPLFVQVNDKVMGNGFESADSVVNDSI